MKSYTSLARRGAIVSVAAASALALAACSAGQITQTSSQVAAVDGASGESENNAVTVQDVTLILDENGQAAVKFVASNQDYSMKEHTLSSITVNGQNATVESAEPIKYNCTLVGDSAAGLEAMPHAEDDCIQYVETSIPNQNFAYGGNVNIAFTFDTGTIELPATVSAPILASGHSTRDESAHAGQNH
ncbi:hypothetical protein [Corynebacterium aquatimens]|uniref:Lipoprotein LpqE n=1 Tax=Corynebacterium aquatimens TaxID=1190508 RepID=A0A931GRT5_9CORY|nr:hypothetical protein [Corynebacterium aquatimens]MBG6122323.1 hypothetical protein [Corynebacterium aquatimens]WJY65135.1 hypothetical protein CAQUA_02010 [Corynebacterium aquatimens]